MSEYQPSAALKFQGNLLHGRALAVVKDYRIEANSRTTDFDCPIGCDRQREFLGGFNNCHSSNYSPFRTFGETRVLGNRLVERR